MDELKQYVKQVKKTKPADEIEPLPPVKTYEAFHYKAHRLRNPFSPSGPATRGGPNIDRPKEPLEAYPLDALEMVGSLAWKGENLWALIRSPNGIVYRVKNGAHIGRNYGKITRITKNRTKILEYIKKQGKWIRRLASLPLSDSE